MGPSTHEEQPYQTVSSLISPCLSGTMIKIPSLLEAGPFKPLL